MFIRKIITAFFLFVACKAIAQQNKVDTDQENFFRFGAKAGLNVNKITGQSYKSGFNYNYQLGGFLQFNFSNRFGLQPEVNFVQSSAEFSNDPADVYDDIFRDGSQKRATLNYLEVPLLLNINAGVSKRVKLQIGPAFGGLLKQSIDSLRAGNNIYRNVDWAAVAGLWIQLPLVNIGARYKLGLSNLNAIDDQQKWKSQSIQMFVGVTF